MIRNTEYLTVTEAAKVAKINHQVLRRLIRAGTIPAVRIGRQWRIRADFIERLENNLQNIPQTP